MLRNFILISKPIPCVATLRVIKENYKALDIHKERLKVRHTMLCACSPRLLRGHCTQMMCVFLCSITCTYREWTGHSTTLCCCVACARVALLCAGLRGKQFKICGDVLVPHYLFQSFYLVVTLYALSIILILSFFPFLSKDKELEKMSKSM